MTSACYVEKFTTNLAFPLLLHSDLYGHPDEMIPLLTKTPELQLASLELTDEHVAPSDIATRIFKQYLGGPHFGLENAEAVTQVCSLWPRPQDHWGTEGNNVDDDGDDVDDATLQMYGDRVFVVGEAEVSHRYAEAALTYIYQLTHRGQHSLTDLFTLGGSPLPFKCEYQL